VGLLPEEATMKCANRLTVSILFFLCFFDAGCGENSDPELIASREGREGEGPVLRVGSNIAGTWFSTESSETRWVFPGERFHFTWSAEPDGAPIAGFSYALDDTSSWSPFSLETTDFPEQIPGDPEELYDLTPGIHALFVRVMDTAGALRALAARLQVFSGPRSCPQNQRFILAVLDTDPTSLQDDGTFPVDYRPIERTLVDFLFAGFNFQIHDTHGTERPRIDQMSCASTTFWMHSASPQNNDNSVLLHLHQPRSGSPYTVIPNFLPSYIRSGGNLLLCGIQPVNALRYFEDFEEGQELVLEFPIDFCSTLDDPGLVPHWAATDLGVCGIEKSIHQADDQPVLSLAKSQITAGSNPYPDLPFDPNSIPNGKIQGGFRYFDTGIEPAGDAEVIYTDANSGDAVGIRKLVAPGVNGNTIFLGFHPYFIEKNAFRQFLRRALKDFGEARSPHLQKENAIDPS
jgi:hypothetical protein